MKSVATHDALIIVRDETDAEITRFDHDQIQARNGHAEIRTRFGELLRAKSNATAARRDADTGGWVVEFSDGETWSYKQHVKKCGACP